MSWHNDFELCSFSRPFAVSGDLAIMHFDDPPGEWQAKAQSSIPVRLLSGLFKRLEDPCNHFRSHARAGVRDFDDQRFVGVSTLDNDASFRGRELGGIVQQIGNSLGES